MQILLQQNEKAPSDDQKRHPEDVCIFFSSFPMLGQELAPTFVRKVRRTGCYGFTGPVPSAVLDKIAIGLGRVEL